MKNYENDVAENQGKTAIFLVVNMLIKGLFFSILLCFETNFLAKS